jgi:hypothetical protein
MKCEIGDVRLRAWSGGTLFDNSNREQSSHPKSLDAASTQIKRARSCQKWLYNPRIRFPTYSKFLLLYAKIPLACWLPENRMLCTDFGRMEVSFCKSQKLKTNVSDIICGVLLVFTIITKSMIIFYITIGGRNRTNRSTKNHIFIIFGTLSTENMRGTLMHPLWCWLRRVSMNLLLTCQRVWWTGWRSVSAAVTRTWWSGPRILDCLFLSFVFPQFGVLIYSVKLKSYY